MLIVALAVALTLAFCRPAHAQSKAFVVSEWAVLAGHGLDAAATQHCIGAGRCRELNPWLGRYDSPVTFTAAKFGVAGLQLWAVRKLRPSHPRLATMSNYLIAAGFTSIALRNQRIGS